MRNRCKNNYREAFGAVSWAKKKKKKRCLKKILGVATTPPPFGGRGLKINHICIIELL